ncbi:MAG: hypothetical protein BZY87_10215 [SAR202 cluster bacterium Io17-Chloro-G6]|nr:MAG: hypothetical protein BZY87_10215 [SAR202 cluster bacterium Io17-Chloro-G6]
MDRALELKAHDLDFGNRRVTTHHANRVPPTMVDEHQLVQAVLNILTNAERAMKARRGPGEITVVTRLADGMIRTSISDNGPGIPAEHLHSIFDRFFTTKGEGQGTGLGLSICYGIVREHKGEIWQRALREREPHSTSIFRLCLATCLWRSA